MAFTFVQLAISGAMLNYHRRTDIPEWLDELLTVLFNAPTTMSNHYTSQVNHDMYAGGW